ncbi:MAG: hypothetical protein KA007_03260 [Candidatus Pacebacteria bacterium]|nr:hypothetical protein [Candidatus Paceibacterota bacterium]
MKYIDLSIKGHDRILILYKDDKNAICFLMDPKNGMAITDPSKVDEFLDEAFYNDKKTKLNAKEHTLTGTNETLAESIVKEAIKSKLAHDITKIEKELLNSSN